MNETNETIQEDVTPDVEDFKSEEEPKPQTATIHVDFKTNSDKIQIISKATQEKNTIVAANKKLRLIHGRLYFIPVDKNVNSDEYGNIKQFSETSDKFEIKYIKDGFACINPVQHNTQLINGQQLCILW